MYLKKPFIVQKLNYNDRILKPPTDLKFSHNFKKRRRKFPINSIELQNFNPQHST